MSGEPRPVFYFDLGSPYAYLAAERINSLFDPEPVWQPVLLGGLFRENGRSSWALGPDRNEGLAECERRAAEYGLPPLRWPDPFPPESTLFAMRVATYAKQLGRTVAFALSAFRQAFAAGRDLTDRDNVLVAAASIELHPRAILANAEREPVKQALVEATAEAHRRGVIGVPSVAVGNEVFWGDDRLEEAAAAARAAAA